ncbi:MAG: hypothetical protein KJ066_16390 [Acidobacteria bacterium]|nr:hypothetical protein [Acidobacteriota bacterium]
MEDRSKVGAFALVGAALGGLIGFLFFTDSGRRVRAEVGPKLEDLLEGTRQLAGHLETLRDVAGEGWQSVSRLVTHLPDAVEGWPGGGRPGRPH